MYIFCNCNFNMKYYTSSVCLNADHLVETAQKSWTHVMNVTFRRLTHLYMMINPYIIIKWALRFYDVSHIFSFRLRIVLRMTTILWLSHIQISGQKDTIWIYLEFLYRDNSHICTQKTNVELRQKPCSPLTYFGSMFFSPFSPWTCVLAFHSKFHHLLPFDTL